LNVQRVRADRRGRVRIIANKSVNALPRIPNIPLSLCVPMKRALALDRLARGARQPDAEHRCRLLGADSARAAASAGPAARSTGNSLVDLAALACLRGRGA